MFRLLFRLTTLLFTLMAQAMVATFGRQSTYTTGTSLMALAGPLAKADWKVGGLTVDWTTVAAASGDQTLADGTVVKNGQKGMQFGQVLAKITATGLYGPYDSGAADGRQTLARGDCWILNESVLQNVPTGLSTVASSHPAVFDGGRVYQDRIQVIGGAAATYQGATTRVALAAFETAFPRIQWVRATS